MIFLHGLRTSHTMWRGQLEALAAAGIPATAIDLPGHGTRVGEKFSLTAARTVIGEAVAQAQEFGGRPYLVGFSLGGYLAIDWVARNPGHVCGLLASSCGTEPRAIFVTPYRLLARLIHTLPDRGRALNDFMVHLAVPEPGASDVLAGGVPLDVMDDTLRELTGLRSIAQLRTLDVPVLLVNGRLDHFRLHAHRYLAAARSGRLVTIPGATHMVSVIQPARFTSALFSGYEEATGRTRSG
ncbi:alpha/beta fold hydrolase [Homoserinimonas sp. OAct 916]|uniref:alpha/beta fold hydrolase n=1 Tax=Homoserinimonas sp. OAct 916 TaxID=2211450 RepID=UPI001E46F274|nr:alpha/beta hydrolase [Homoserinimonas sp. OAct 916]